MVFYVTIFFGNLLHAPSLCDTIQFFNGYESHYGGPWPAPVAPLPAQRYLSLSLSVSLSVSPLSFSISPSFHFSGKSQQIGMQSAQSVTATWLNSKPSRLIAAPHYVTKSRANPTKIHPALTHHLCHS